MRRTALAHSAESRAALARRRCRLATKVERPFARLRDRRLTLAEAHIGPFGHARADCLARLACPCEDVIKRLAPYRNAPEVVLDRYSNIHACSSAGLSVTTAKHRVAATSTFVPHDVIGSKDTPPRVRGPSMRYREPGVVAAAQPASSSSGKTMSARIVIGSTSGRAPPARPGLRRARSPLHLCPVGEDSATLLTLPRL